MPLPGCDITIDFSTDDGAVDTYVEADGIKNASFSESPDMLDSTDFKQSDRAKHRFQGLSDGSISLDGDLEPADAGQAKLLAARRNGTQLWCRIRWDGTNGDKVVCRVTGREVSGGVEGSVEVSYSLEWDGIPVSVP
jgi:hypothetical protein